MSNEIKNLPELLRNYIGPNKEVVDVKVGPLSETAENYGSILYKVDVILKSEDGKEEKLYAVAKLIPLLEKARLMSDVQVSVKKEIAMFNRILPTLQELQRENGVKDIVDYLPELYGWRLNLHGNNDVVDEDSVILMENLNGSGYVNVDRFVGLDLDTAKSALIELAAFHALPIALKLKKPEVFQEKIRPLLTPHKPPFNPKKEKSHVNVMDKIVLEALDEDPKCTPYMPKVREILASKDLFNHVPPKEPFASVSHGDLWINNVMVKFDGNRPVRSKIIDFQFYDYKSPARDLFFFLFTGVQAKVLEESFDSLVKFYHDHFISRLEELGCDTRLFDLEHFLEELKESAVLELKHTLVFTLFVVMRRQPISVGFYPGKPRAESKIREDMCLDAKIKARTMIYLCGKKGWL